jgi:hypothetical protein
MVIVVRAVPLEKIRLGTGSCLPSCQVPLGPRLSIISIYFDDGDITAIA